MSEARRNTKKGSSATATNPTRPMWFLGPNGMPVAASSKKVPAGVTAFCYEHDTEWTPINQERRGDGPGPLAATA